MPHGDHFSIICTLCLLSETATDVSYMFVFFCALIFNFVNMLELVVHEFAIIKGSA